MARKLYLWGSTALLTCALAVVTVPAAAAARAGTGDVFYMSPQAGAPSSQIDATNALPSDQSGDCQNAAGSGSVAIEILNKKGKPAGDASGPAGPPVFDPGVWSVLLAAPPEVGTYTVQPTCILEDPSSSFAYASQTFVVLSHPRQARITSSCTMAVIAGHDATKTITVKGDPIPTVSLSGGAPPSWASFDGGAGGATVNAAPPSGVHGQFIFGITAYNGVTPEPGGAPSSCNFTVTVLSPPRLSARSAWNVHPGHSVRLRIHASGYPKPAVTEHGALPHGLSFHARARGAIISGKVTKRAKGTYHVVLTAKNPAGVIHHTLVITVA